MPNRLLLLASENKKLESIASKNRFTRPIVDRYVAGETLAEALTVTAELNAKGIDVSLDLLGESVGDLEESRRATDEYVEAIEALGPRSTGATVSVKLSQLGVVMSPEACEENLRRLLDAARASGIEVEVDMEYSAVGRDTLAIYQRILPDYPETRQAFQAYLRGVMEDLRDFPTEPGGPLPKIRLVKGAFEEPIDLVLKDKADVTAQYNHLARWALAHLPDPAFGTHDDRCIDVVKRAAVELGVGKRDFEFQMLHGVRRPLQEQLVAEGYRVRVYLPYGDQWYPYLTRRMAERPANLFLFLRSVVSK